MLLIAGETSGDMLAGQLVSQALADSENTIDFYGIGGKQAQAAGMRLLMHYRHLAVMGATEVVCHLHSIFQALRQIKAELSSHPPDLVILVDYGGFNLRVAKYAHQRGIKVLYYVPPKFWAWRPQRLKKIQRYVDHVAVILPFEIPLYQQANVSVTGIRHFLLDQVEATQTRPQFLQQHQLKTTQPTLCLMPGSRRSEIKQLLKPMLQAAKLLEKQHPNLQCLLPIADGIDPAAIKAICSLFDLNITLIAPAERYNAIASADATITASGTATLEVALLNTPMVVIYRFAPLTFLLIKALIQVKWVSLCNLLLQRESVPELIQSAANPKQIASTTHNLLIDQAQRQQMQQDFKQLRQDLDNPALVDWGRFFQIFTNQLF